MSRKAMGWREWVGLPGLGVGAIEVKVDTGAASSSLHAFRMERFEALGTPMARFEIHPRRRSGAQAVMVETEVVDERLVRNPGGRQEIRPVVRTAIAWSGVTWPTEINLTRRDEMGYRMLLGRRALRGRFVVDPSRSFLGGRPADDGAGTP